MPYFARLAATFSAIILATTAPLAAQQRDTNGVTPLTAEQTAAVGDIIARGEALYRYDQAAWHTTDKLVAAHIPQEVMRRIIGWVVVPAPEGLKVIYYGREADRHIMIYSSVWSGGTDVSAERRYDPEFSILAGEEARLVALREQIDASGFLLCASRPFNTVILPASVTSASDSVYFLTPQVDNRTVPLGGHHRVDIVDGVQRPVRSVTRSCINMPPPPRGAMFGINHITSAVPTEEYIFTALTQRRSFVVMTPDNGTAWIIEPRDGRATLGTVRMADRH
ncbi:MAG: hypothetical protein ABL882_01270 [Sphingopyxis sp.]